MKIIEITNDKDLISKLSSAVVNDNNSSHRNTRNYINLQNRDFLKFHVLKQNNEIVSFAGMYRHPTWPKNIIRVVDRMYTFFEFRVKNGNGFSSNKPNLKENTHHGGLCSGQLLPYQTKIARELNLIPFVSIQFLTRRNAVKKWLKSRIDPSLGYELLDDLYYTCGGSPSINIRCWQNILSPEKLSLPSMDVDMYKHTFSKGINK
jgi:hypothetical protein